MNRNDDHSAAQKIRDRYAEKKFTELDELRKLDARVKRPVNVFAYVFGSISAMIMGAGMSLIMTDIGKTVGIEEPLVSGIIIGGVGLIMALINYPLYNAMLRSRKKKYAEKILKLSEKIIKG